MCYKPPVVGSLCNNYSRQMNATEYLTAVSCASVSKRVSVQNISYENKFALHKNEHIGGTHLYMNGLNKTRFETEAKGLLEMACSHLPEPNSFTYHNLPRFVFWDRCILQESALSLKKEKNSSVQEKHKGDIYRITKETLTWLTINLTSIITFYT